MQKMSRCLSPDEVVVKLGSLKFAAGCSLAPLVFGRPARELCDLSLAHNNQQRRG